MSDVFHALDDATRRAVLDRLRERDGQTQSEIEAAFPEMTRFGVMKHLRVLEAVGLVVSHKVGRTRYHYLNPVPLQEVADRWISRFASPFARALVDLRQGLENPTSTNDNRGPTAPPTLMNKPKHVFTTIIRTTPEKLWDALTNPAQTPFYYFGGTVHHQAAVGSRFAYTWPDGKEFVGGTIVEWEPPRRLVTRFEGKWEPGLEADAPSRVTFEIKPQGHVCVLTLVHDDFPAETATYHATGGGWPGILSGLKTYLETGEPLNYDPMAA